MRVRLSLTAAIVVLAAAPVAEAKFRLSLTLSSARPAVAERVSVGLTAGVALPPDHELLLIAVAPRVGMYAAMRSVDRRGTLDSRLGFVVPLERTSESAWRGELRFRRPGRWLLVVPNWGPVGYAIPPPVVRAVNVRRR